MKVATNELEKKMTLFAGNVVKYMKANGVTDEQMAALLGIKKRTLSDKLKDPRRFTLDEIVKITYKLNFDEHSMKETFCIGKGVTQDVLS